MTSLPRSVTRTLCFLVLVLSVPLLAQKGGGGGTGGGSGTGGGGGKPGGMPSPVSVTPTANTPSYVPGYGTNFGYDAWLESAGTCNGTWACPPSTRRTMPATPIKDDPTCFLAPIAGIHSATVSLTRLEVPHKAVQEYEKACSALKHNEFSKAEEHLQKAVELYPGYAAAWVQLGQVEELEHKTTDAAQSCSRARQVDSGYAPSYLCLAYLIAEQKKWDELKQVTDDLLRLHPINASNAYYYSALAYFHLKKLSVAEISARRGVEDSKKHQPRLHLLLAQIYEQEGNRNSEIAELHEYLKRDPHGDDVTAVNNLLKQIETATAAKR